LQQVKAGLMLLMCLCACRMLYAFSRDGAVPMSRWWREVNPYFEAPVNAVCHSDSQQ
jgi:amino acid transporter